LGTGLKQYVKEIWKYYPKSNRRFGLKVTLDDGAVSAWNKKNAD
jgi:hypothetical protein